MVFGCTGSRSALIMFVGLAQCKHLPGVGTGVLLLWNGAIVVFHCVGALASLAVGGLAGS